LFKGAVGDFSKQEHDFNPGIKRTGLFWTVRMPADLLDSNAPVGRAHMRARRMAVPDFHDFFNSISPRAKGQPGHVSSTSSGAATAMSSESGTGSSTSRAGSSPAVRTSTSA